MTDGRHPPEGCLDAETLAAFIDGRLEPRERAAVEAHLAECEDCYEAWMESIRLAAEAARSEAVPVATPQRSTRWMIWAASIAAALALTVWTSRSFLTGSDRPEIRELVTAMASARPVEARLTGGFAWGPVPSATRSGTQSQTAPAVTIAAAQLQQRLEQQRTAETLAGFATGQMALATSQSLDAAIQALKEATAMAPDNAFYWSDLGAAYYSRYQLDAQALDLPEASEAIESALSLKPDLIEARFNRALILEKLGLQERALQAWRDDLALDGRSPWAAEAQQHITRLERGASATRDRETPAALRDRLFDKVLADWATADANRMAHVLSEADEVNRSLNAYPDVLALEVVQVLKQSSETQAQSLRIGHKAYGAAREAYLVNQYAEAEKEFLIAVDSLTRAGSPLALSAATFIATIKYRGGHLEDARKRLTTVRANLKDRNYLSLVGRVDWVLGLIALVQGDFAASETRYASAAALFKQAGELENYAFMQVLLAERLEWSGDVSQAWAARLSELPETRRSGALFEAAKAARGSGFAQTAVLFEVEAVERERKGASPLNLVDALRHLAASRAAAGNHIAAHELIAEARAVLSSSDPNWDRTRAELDLTAALAADPAHALEALDGLERSLAYFTKEGADGRLPEVLLARARLNRLLDRPQPAREDLERARTLLDRQLTTVADPQLRATFGNQLARLGDDWIAIEAAAEDFQAAWEAAERARTWLPTEARAVPAKSLTLSEAQARIPDRTAVLYFALTDGQLHVWSIGRSAFDHQSTPAPKGSVERLVDAFRSSHASGTVGLELRRLLIDPVAQGLTDAETLVVVPDGPLHLVPFSALPGLRNRFLVEEHALVVAQSLATALRSTSPPSANQWTATAIGNPTLDRNKHPALADLPNAGIEARMVANKYGDRGQLITGPEATADRVLARMAGSRVIHVASHAVVNRSNPGLSALVLAGGSTITAHEIAAASFDKTHLVVLAACQSADGQLTRNGPLGLATAFLQAGVKAVVAGYWVVEDAAALELFRAFYDHYRENGNQVEALRQAQLALLHSGNPSLNSPRQWAAFAAFGNLGHQLTNGEN